MKKVFSLLIILIACCSCSEDLKINNVSVFQGVKNNETWIGSDAKATITATTLTVQAVTLTETLTLTVPVPAMPIDPGNNNSYITHVLGVSNAKRATYTVKATDGDVVYETGTLGDGEIVISEYNTATVSGTFRFNAMNTDPDAADTAVNYQKGVFYKVNIVPSL